MTAGMAAFAFIFLAVAHSVLGEQSILRPLFKCPDWDIGYPRPLMERLLRFAWHATSLAWLGLAWVMVGASPGRAVGAVGVISGAIVFLTLRGHLSWPIFLGGGLAALDAANVLPGWVQWLFVSSGVLVASAAALLHMYWAGGGKRWLGDVVPQRADGGPLFRPGPVACMAVALALLLFSGLLVRTALNVATPWEWGATIVAFAFLGLRAVGDGRQVGFTKTDRSTTFARADDVIYTPLVVVLAFGAAMALV